MPVRFIDAPAQLYAAAHAGTEHARDLARAENLRRSQRLAVNRPVNIGPRIAR